MAKDFGYPSAVLNLIDGIINSQKKSVELVSRRMCASLESGGIVYVFGSGHSAILTEEAFHRAGGLVPVYPVLHSFLSPYTAPSISGKLERVEGIAPILFERTGAKKGDLFFIASNSGVNAAAIEMAMCCKKSKIESIGFTSLQHSKKTKSRHSSGKKLYELVDHVIDNSCPSGDGLVVRNQIQIGAGSSIANTFLWNWILDEACKLWIKNGKELPIYRSANLPGGDEYNKALESSLAKRIPLL